MVYINSKGEVIDETRPTPINLLWKIVTFFILFFKTLIGIEDKPDKKKEDKGSSSRPSGSTGGFFDGGSGGKPGNRKFGPRGFKSITDLPPPPPPMGGCAGGACG